MSEASGKDAANLVEIFASAQGEGPWVGAETIFVRLGECDLRCAWCDSPGTWRRARRCRIEEAPGTGRFRDVENPIDLWVSYDDAHPNARAHAMIARYTVDFIDEVGSR